MPGKRKRGGTANTDSSAPDSKERNAKPISAVAAARLKSQPPPQQEIPSIENRSSAGSPPSSEIEEEPPVLEDEPPVPQPNVHLCTWRYGPDFVSSESEEQVTVSLRKGATVTLIGCFDFTVLKGAININGANFGALLRRGEQRKTHRAYVPSTHPISVIRGLDSQNEVQFMDCPEATPLGPLNSLFRNIWNAKPPTGRAKSFSLITESDADPLHRPLIPEIIPEDWIRQVDECATTFGTTLIIGPPSSGKSNLAKRLLNRYLTGLGKMAQPIPSVYFLDLDMSKPAYTPHGQISLARVQQVELGPPFTHPHPLAKSEGGNEIVRAHPLPVHGTLNYLDHFLASTDDLIRTYQTIREREPSAPLIINTPGWLYTSTFSTLLHLLPRPKPQNLIVLADLSSIDIDTASKLHTLDTNSRKQNTTVSHISAIPPPPSPSPYTDMHHRDMHMQSYFHLRASKTSPEPTFSPLPLTHLRPWEFSLSETATSSQSLIGVLALCDPSSLAPPNSLQTILNGAIVHIMETSDADTIAQYGTLPRTPDRFGIPYFPAEQDTGAVKMLDPTTSRIVATALVRGWDVDRGVVQVVVPKGVDSIMASLEPERTVFVVGACEGAGWTYVEDAEYGRSEGGGGEVGGLGPWVERREVVDGMGYLCVPRRVRRFQQ